MCHISSLLPLIKHSLNRSRVLNPGFDIIVENILAGFTLLRLLSIWSNASRIVTRVVTSTSASLDEPHTLSGGRIMRVVIDI